MRLLTAKLFFILLEVFGISGKFADDAVTQTVKVVAEHNQSGCITVLFTEERMKKNLQEIYRIVYLLSSSITLTVHALTFDRFIMHFASRNPKPIDCKSPLILVLHDDFGTNKMFSKLSRSHDFQIQKYSWLVFLQKSIGNFFRNIHTPFNLDLLVAKIKREDFVELYEVYRVANSKPLRVPRFGQWTKENGLEAFDWLMTYNRRYNLEGIVLRTGSTDNAPIHSFETDKNGNTILTGYFPEVWRQLEEILNFSSKNYQSVDKVTGIPERGGCYWSGLVGMLQRNEIDAAVSDFIMDGQRISVVDFTKPLLKTSYQLFFQSAGSDLNWGAILRPFHTDIWLLLLLWILIASVVLAICHGYTHKKGLEHNTKSEDFNLVNSVLFFTKALCNQGHTFVPSTHSCRIIYIMGYAAAAVLIPSYSAALISFLTMKTPLRPFDSLAELVSVGGNYRLQTNSKTAEYTYFSESRDEEVQALYNHHLVQIPEDQLPLNTKQGLEMVCRDPFLVHFGDMAVATPYLNKINEDEDNKCSIITLSQPISTVYSCMALVRNSPYREVINHFLQRMEVTGIIDRIMDQTIPKKQAIAPNSWSEVEGTDVAQMFVFLIIGMLSSVIVFLIEKIVQTLERHNQRKNDKKKCFQHFTHRQMFLTFPVTTFVNREQLTYTYNRAYEE